MAQAKGQTALVITTVSLPDAYIGQFYNFAMNATGGKPGTYFWSIISGQLPQGISLNSKTGVLSGTPTVGGAVTVTINVTSK